MPDKPRKPRSAAASRDGAGISPATPQAPASESAPAPAEPSPPLEPEARATLGSLPGGVEATLGDITRPPGVAAPAPVKMTRGAPPVETATPELSVAAFAEPGVYVFSVTVVDDLGAVSAPARFSVQVKVLSPIG